MPNKTSKQELYDRLDALLGEAAQNEIKLKKFQAFELVLMNAASLAELIETLLVDALAEFDWDAVGLTLYDPNYEFQRLLNVLEESTDHHPGLHFTDTPEIPGNATATQPKLTPYSDSQHAKVFLASDRKPDYIWSLPLNKYSRFIGYYYIGKSTNDHLDESSATDFLQHLATVIAICLTLNIDRENLRYLGLKDPLTGINNRRFFDQRLTEEILNAVRANVAISCLFIDIDHFKRINDTHGHRAGDIILQGVAQKIRWLLRATDVFARYGGEEFIALLLSQGQHEATEIAERVRLAIEHNVFTTPDHKRINVTVSIGINTFKGNDRGGDIKNDACAFVDRADHALYEAKRTGRNRIVHACNLD